MPKVTERTVKIGGIDVLITETEYEQFRRRNKIIFWIGEGKCEELGVFTTILSSQQEVHGFSKVYYEPLYYEVKMNAQADPSEVEEYYTEPTIKGEYEFDDKEEAEEFIEGVKMKGVNYGSINIDSRASFKRWKTAIEQVFKEEK